MTIQNKSSSYFKHLLCVALIGLVFFLGTTIQPSSLVCFSRNGAEDNHDSWVALSSSMQGGHVSAVVIDPRNEKRFFAASRTHGVFLSEDQGLSWKCISMNLKKKTFQCLTINPLDKYCLYAGAYDEIYRSYDMGKSWEKSPTAFRNVIAILALEDGSILAGTSDGIYKAFGHVKDFKFYRSLDNLAGYNEMYSLGISSNRKVIAAGTAKHAVILSFDNGSSWTRVNNSFPSDTVIAVIFDRFDLDSLYAVTSGSGVWHYDIIELETKENRIPWKLVHPETKGLKASCAIQSFQKKTELLLGTEDDGLYILEVHSNKLIRTPHAEYNATVTALAVGQNDPDLILSGSNLFACLISKDYGAQWSIIYNQFNAVDTQKLLIDSKNPSSWYLCAYGSIWATRNSGKSWNMSHEGLPPTPITCLAITPNNRQHLFAGTENQGLYQSFDRGKTFEQITHFPFKWINCMLTDYHDDGIVYVGTHGRGLFKTEDGGKTWISLSINPNKAVNSVFISSLAMDPHDSSILYAGAVDDGIYKSTNKGKTWSNIYEALGGNLYINDIVIDSKNTDVIYAGINIINNGGIIRTLDQGKSWEALNLFRTGMIFKSVVIDADDSEIIFAGTRENVFISKNGGYQWKEYAQGFLPEIYDEKGFIHVHTIMTHPEKKQMLLVSTRWGVFECFKSEITMDREIPQITITSPSTFPHYTKTGQVSIKGFVSDNTGIQQVLQGETPILFDRTEGSFTYLHEFDENETWLSFKVIDLAGNENSTKLHFLLDQKKPLLTLLKPDNYLSTERNDILIEGFAQDLENQIARVEVNGIAMPLEDKEGVYHFAYSYKFLHKGENDIEVVAYDLAGNSNSRSVKVFFKSQDKHPPEVRLITPGDVLSYAKSPRFLIVGFIVDDDSGLFRSSLNGREFQVEENGSFSLEVRLNHGENMFNLTSIDYNDNSISYKFSIILDTVKPKLKIIGNLPEKTILHPFPFRFHAFDEHTGISRVECIVNDELQKTISIIDSEEHQLDLSLSPGLNEVKLLAYDYAQNQEELLLVLERVFPSIIKLRIGSNKVIVIRGEEQREDTLSTAPMIYQNRTMVPLRFISENFGARVDWIPHPTNEIQLSYQDMLVHLWIGSKKVIIEYPEDTTEAPKEIFIDTAPMIRNSSTLVPLRFLSELFGAKVDWDAKTQEITLTFY